MNQDDDVGNWEEEVPQGLYMDDKQGFEMIKIDTPAQINEDEKQQEDDEKKVNINLNTEENEEPPIDLSVNPFENYELPKMENKIENLKNFKGRVEIKKGKWWTGNPQDRISQSFTVIGYFVINIHFYFFVAQWFDEVLDFPHLKYIILPPILIIGYNVYKCIFTEPGIIPRGNLEQDPTPYLQELQKQVKAGTISADQHNQSIANMLHNNNISVLNPETDLGNYDENNTMLQNKKQKLDLRFYTYRYCKTCKIMRPPKSSHCSRCDACVQTFDHHCFFIGNCVGARNIKNFFTFLVTTLIYGYAVICLTLYKGYYILKQQENLLEEFNKHEKSKYFFFVTLFLYMWRMCCGCPRRLHVTVGQVFLLSVLNLLIQMGSSSKTAFFGDGESSDYEDQSWYDWYNLNSVSVIGMMILASSAMSVASPLACQTMFNVSRGITQKEKHQIDDQTNFRYKYNMSFKETLENYLQFLSYKKPPSYYFD